jgi:hypothetical protein
MLKPAALLMVSALPLAACNSSPTIEARNATVAEVAEKVDKAGGVVEFLSPGKWLNKATMGEFSAPGMPPGIADNMKAAMDKKPGTEQCMKAGDVKKPRTDFFAGNKNCRYDHFKMGDGVIDAKMRCDAGGHTQLMTMAGNYKPDEYHMTMTTEMDRGTSGAAGAMGSMTMKMRVDGKRIGECDAKTS